jgi:hypothetical protein
VQGLRASVRSRAFWERGLARAWHRKVCRCSLSAGFVSTLHAIYGGRQQPCTTFGQFV